MVSAHDSAVRGDSIVTIRDIAKIVGVSHSTVSRALRDDPRISLETKEKVRRVARELNYYPNASARSLISKRMQSIGLVIPHVHDSFYGQIIVGVDAATYEAGYNLILYLTHAERSRELAALEQINQRRVDGVVVMARTVDVKLFQKTMPPGIPMVILGDTSLTSAVDTVSFDNVDGGYQATRHLCEQGHTRIGFLAGLRDSEERLAGYQLALREYGLSPKDYLVKQGDYTEASGRRAMSEWHSETPDRQPTAIFATNDRMAIGVLEQLQELDRDDVAVVGFDDIAAASYITPKLTTVKQPLQELGSAAAELLIRRLNQPDAAPRSIKLKGSLLVRESSLVGWTSDDQRKGVTCRSSH